MVQCQSFSALCKLLIHLYAGRNYGFFRDELYYLACSRHLDWGYVDQPPLIALMAWITRTLPGVTTSPGPARPKARQWF